MNLILKYKLYVAVLLVALAAAGAGLHFAGVIGGKDAPVPKAKMHPVPLTEPFVVNLADTDSSAYAKLGLAIELEPMTALDKQVFEHGADAGGHGGGDVETGAQRLAAYAPLRDAVYDTVGRFDSQTLLSPSGKEELKKALLANFDHVADRDAPPHPKKGEQQADAHHDPAAPPYHVKDVYFTEYAIQVQ